MGSSVVAPPVVPVMDASEPPPFVRLASHAVRWRLLRELVRSDRAVSELMTLVDEPQSLVSYHLRQLRDGGLVSARRSAADRRDSYYRIDLDACRGAWDHAGAALHPALRASATTSPLPREPARGADHPRPQVLFLCTGNSARSQMAEALLVHLSAGTVEARSAGSHPKPLHPNAVRVLAARGIDISANRSKHLDEVAAEHFDQVITLCDRVREVCPELPSHPERVHWSIPDPALEGSTDEASYAAFERTADELERRLAFQLHHLTEPPTRRTHDDER